MYCAVCVDPHARDCRIVIADSSHSITVCIVSGRIRVAIRLTRRPILIIPSTAVGPPSTNPADPAKIPNVARLGCHIILVFAMDRYQRKPQSFAEINCSQISRFFSADGNAYGRSWSRLYGRLWSRVRTFVP